MNFKQRRLSCLWIKSTLPGLLFMLSVQSWAQSPDITISGASEALAENIRAHLGVEDERCNAPIQRLNRRLPDVRRSVERAAQALGYYRVTQQLEFVAAQPCWNLQITLETGEPVRFGDINVSVATTPENAGLFRNAVTASPVTTGGVLNHSDYETLKSALSAVAIDNGFFTARVNRAELAVDLQRNVADVHLEFDPGERFDFGDIQITPLDELSEQFISRFIPFGENTPYSTEMLVSLRQNLNDSQYFSQVTVTPQLNLAQNQQIPVTVDLTPRPRHSYTVGIGATTDIGPRLRLAYEDRYLNRRGHRLLADLALAPMQQEPNISYIIPLRDPAYESLRFSGGYLGQETDSYSSQTFRLGANYRTRIRSEWAQNIFVNFQREDFEIIDIEEQTDFTVLGINWSKTQADDPIYPTRGWRLFTQISGSSENLLSNISYTQLYASAKLIRSLGPGRMLLRTEVATTLADEVLELPASVRYFAGGDTSVRGYQFGELGALNDQGEVIGGKHLLTASIEADFGIREGWRAAVFYDTGNSFADFNNMQLQNSIGVGVRWQSPIGPIRVDVARATADGSFRLHLSMGPDL